ncbi:MAG: hypothetical protein ACRDI3_03320 [Actinomycetota bacterium]
MSIFQCPDCELRFRFASELVEHVTSEHPDFRSEPKSLEDSLLSAAHLRRRAGSYEPHPTTNAHD